VVLFLASSSGLVVHLGFGIWSSSGFYGGSVCRGLLDRGWRFSLLFLGVGSFVIAFWFV